MSGRITPLAIKMATGKSINSGIVFKDSGANVTLSASISINNRSIDHDYELSSCFNKKKQRTRKSAHAGVRLKKSKGAKCSSSKKMRKGES